MVVLGRERVRSDSHGAACWSAAMSPSAATVIMARYFSGCQVRSGSIYPERNLAHRGYAEFRMQNADSHLHSQWTRRRSAINRGTGSAGGLDPAKADLSPHLSYP